MLPLLQGGAEVPDGQYLPEPSEAEDRRTPAERRYDEMMAKRAAEKTKKMAMKSHRWAVLVSDVFVNKIKHSEALLHWTAVQMLDAAWPLLCLQACDVFCSAAEHEALQ